MGSAQASVIRVLLVDDHRLLTDALSGLLSREPDIEVCGVAASVTEAHDSARLPMDVVLMDYSLPDGTAPRRRARSRAAGLRPRLCC